MSIFDLEKDDEDPTYRDIKAFTDGKVFILKGKQLEKIFNSTNFNDMGSLRYLYKYIENKGALETLKEMGLKEGDLIKIVDYEFEYMEEYY